MKKKILFLIDSLHSGGAEKSLVSLLNLLDYTQYDVDLMLISKSGLYLSLVPDEVTIIEPPRFFSSGKSIKNIKELKYMLTKLKYSAYLRMPLKKKKLHKAQENWKFISSSIETIEKEYDVAIAYSQGLPTYVVSSRVKAKKKYCWINTNYKEAGYSKDFDVKYYEEFHGINLVSHEAKEIFLEVYPQFKEKVSIIYDIIPHNLIKKMAEEQVQLAEENFKGTTILTIGRLVHTKGYDMAIEAAKKLKDNGIEFRWYVIGEGILKNELISIIEENGLQKEFKLLGTFTNPYPYIKNCDIYCQPSRFEGFGMAIAEAKILGKPVIATNFETVKNQINHGVNGLVVKMDGMNIFRGIKYLIMDEFFYRNVQDNLIKENLGTESEINKINQLLN
ncbi:glycosyltransferase [Clostridium tarantellae]|uniref:Glycosyltransferase n=1 Tax=Clostridium tarantellae TaxID=39493 RepID=A0A6I1MPR3_9CLOT|nr:glycosyltransferase [Clostridium tarantellae]MPQ42279.1 glycosyltransferase [Clostridium tarantellae]